MKPFFAANVWGKGYIDNFCNFTLPMHFSKNNIPRIKKDTKLKYLIITATQDLKYFKNKKIIKFLQKDYDLSFYPIKIGDKNKYYLISLLQNLSMQLAKSNNFDCMFPLYADVLCSDGTLYNSFSKIKEGHEAVVSLGPQTILSNMEKEIVDSKKYHDGAFSIKISSRELVKLTFQNLHPFHAPSFWEKNNFTTTPLMIF